MPSRTVLIIQARMSSTRLPGKVLRPLLGRPMLGRQLDRLKRCRRVDDIVVATSTLPSDDPVSAFCTGEGVPVFRGSELDVLSRFHGAAVTAGADIVVRVTGDCPLIDAEVIDGCIGRFRDDPEGIDYVSNCLVRSFPRGMDTEVFSRALLETAHAEATAADEREHVTPFMYRHPERFRLGSFLREPDESRFRLTVDTYDDFRLIEAIYSQLFPSCEKFDLEAILTLLKHRNDLVALNAHVEQRQVSFALNGAEVERNGVT